MRALSEHDRYNQRRTDRADRTSGDKSLFTTELEYPLRELFNVREINGLGS